MNPQTTLASVSTGFRCIIRTITTDSLCKRVCIKMATPSKSHVSVKVGTRRKLLLTHITLVWLFSSMRKHVSISFAMCSKSLQTHICVAFVHVQACVF